MGQHATESSHTQNQKPKPIHYLILAAAVVGLWFLIASQTNPRSDRSDLYRGAGGSPEVATQIGVLSARDLPVCEGESIDLVFSWFADAGFPLPESIDVLTADVALRDAVQAYIGVEVNGWYDVVRLQAYVSQEVCQALQRPSGGTEYLLGLAVVTHEFGHAIEFQNIFGPLSVDWPSLETTYPGVHTDEVLANELFADCFTRHVAPPEVFDIFGIGRCPDRAYGAFVSTVTPM